MKSYRQFITDPREIPSIVAHRGAWKVAPENSVAAIEAAADRGYEIVEIDARRAADGGFFLMHDPGLERTTDRTGRAEDLPMSDLTATRLRQRDGGPDAPLTSHIIPTLSDALRAARGRVYLDIDVKHERDLEEVADLIMAEGMTDQVDIKIDVQSGEDGDHLRALQRRFGVVVMPKTYFERLTADDLMAVLSSTGAPIVEATFDALTTIAERREAFRNAGMSIWVNTLDPAACCGLDDRSAAEDPQSVWGVLMAAGASVVQTDTPENLLAYRQTVRRDGQ